MKLKHAVLVMLIGFFAFGFISCSKVSNAIPPAPTTSKFLKGADGPPLWIIDNVEQGYLDDNTKGIVKIHPGDIVSINVLSPSSTPDLVTRYGQKGRNGVILVATKK